MVYPATDTTAGGSGTPTTIAEVKSPVKSKTNIVGVLLSLLGIAGYVGIGSSIGLELSHLASAIVAIGGGLVVWFRTTAKAILGKVHEITG